MKKKNKDVKLYWSMTEGVFNCLIDEERSIAFKKAIENTVRKGDVVVDMGSGSGLLAMFAAKAGAKKVYAVESDKKNILTLSRTIEKNSLQSVIEVIEGDVTSVDIPEKVDVIIGEIIATALIEELQIPAMNNILKYANSNCKVLLKRYSSFLSLVDSPSVYYGLDFPIIKYEYPDLNKLKSRSLSKEKCYFDVDFSRINKIEKINFKEVFTITNNGNLNGIKLSSLTKFWDDSEIWSTFAYSYPIILPVDEIEVKKGEKFSIEIEYTPSLGFKDLKYTINKLL